MLQTAVKIIAGLYYSLAGAYILNKWFDPDDSDYARIGSPSTRPKETQSGNFGFLGMQAGLIFNQSISESSWLTRIPFELHLKRNRPDPDLIQELNEQTALEYGVTPGTYIVKDGTAYNPPQEVRFFIRVHWYDLSGINEIIDKSNILIEGGPEFEECKILDMENENKNAGTNLETYNRNSLNRNIPENNTIPEQHPKYFDVITPKDMEFGALEDIELSFTARIQPAAGYDWKDLREWFNYEDPQGVTLGRVDATGTWQEIKYDYW